MWIYEPKNVLIESGKSLMRSEKSFERIIRSDDWWTKISFELSFIGGSSNGAVLILIIDDFHLLSPLSSLPRAVNYLRITSSSCQYGGSFYGASSLQAWSWLQQLEILSWYVSWAFRKSLKIIWKLKKFWTKYANISRDRDGSQADENGHKLLHRSVEFY